jgi:N6-adenosine-specific RNA methylase IME4
MAHSEACQLFIEQQIDEGLQHKKTPYRIGKELSEWVERLFEAKIPPSTIKKRAQRMRDKMGTNVSTQNSCQEACAITDLQRLIDSGKKFSTIYADPPWQYSNQATRSSTDNHYSTMTLDELCSLPIVELAEQNSHLHLWTTNGFLFDSHRVLESWGYTYKSCFVWVKPQMGIGNYWRVSHEFLLLGVRGNLRFQDKGEMSWRKMDRGKHSKKPYEVRKLIERVSPGPRLELFARIVAPGWIAWGNEIERNLFNGAAFEQV